MSRRRVRKYDGHVSTVTAEGNMTGIYLLKTLTARGENRPRSGVKLIGYGSNVTTAAMDLVAQLRLYADWIAHEHGLQVLDEVTLDEQVKLRTGLGLPIARRRPSHELMSRIVGRWYEATTTRSRRVEASSHCAGVASREDVRRIVEDMGLEHKFGGPGDCEKSLWEAIRS